jgi:hypothetical protein
MDLLSNDPGAGVRQDRGFMQRTTTTTPPAADDATNFQFKPGEVARLAPDAVARDPDWRSHLKVHPAAELFPLMTKDELAELADDIKNNGLKEPVILGHGREGDAMVGTYVLDGRNRLDALELNGVELLRDGRIIDRLFRDLGPVDDPVAYVISKNIHRRHLTAEQKRGLVAALLKTDPEKSNREIANTAGVDHKTVAPVRTKLEATGEITPVEKTKGKDGKARPTRRKKAQTKPEASAAVARCQTCTAKQAARAAGYAARVKQISTINRSGLPRASAGDRP